MHSAEMRVKKIWKDAKAGTRGACCVGTGNGLIDRETGEERASASDAGDMNVDTSGDGERPRSAWDDGVDVEAALGSPQRLVDEADARVGNGDVVRDIELNEFNSAGADEPAEERLEDESMPTEPELTPKK
ncbi:hypothetical protein GE061_015250 [Apolygus lucorum]|uniref:Uncharacterized protein n=1 Tax=Apolygus lucorum TaxID=248454 RepID=A0A8S9XKK0_APOLU|nr:hypothetical protein GE061_015250 [Apolygus lucorum]